MNRYYTLVFVLFAFALLTALAPSPALAQTPDGDPPAVEEVCAEEAGAAFGLCNAYCEAMDCELGFEEAPYPDASENACLKVEARYLQITGRVLYALQCGTAACPPGTEGCTCGEEYFCEGELVCDEDAGICTTGGGDES